MDRFRTARGQIGLVEPADVGSGRDDLIDAVEDIVGQCHVEPFEKVVELRDRARSDQALVMPGWVMANDIARWVIGMPDSVANLRNCSTFSSRLSSSRALIMPVRTRSLFCPRRTRPVNMPWPSGPKR